MKSAFVVGILNAALTTIWLFAGEERRWHEETACRWTELGVPAQGKAGFAQLSPAITGIVFTNTLTEASIAANRVLANGSGVAVGDYDRDGLPDIFFCGLESSNALYKNLGNWKFKDVTVDAGLVFPTKPCRGAVFADINGDGFPDLLVSTLDEGVRCFMNDGRGKFADKTVDARTRSRYAAMTIALADVDGDGTLDLYVANNRPNDIRDRGRMSVSVVNGNPVIPGGEKNRLLFKDGQLAEYGQPDQLFKNDGKGRFTEVSWLGGGFVDETGQPLTGPPLDWGLTATFRDINNDLAPDLYVCNDYWTPDRFWINDGHGNFRAIDQLALRKTSASSMGVDFADIDRDGHLDFFVVDMLSRDPRLRKRQGLAEKPMGSPLGSIANRPQAMRNTMLRNRGDGTFAEIADFARVAAADWAWSCIFTDVDLDGYDDLLISAGHFHDVQDLDTGQQIQARQHSWQGFKDEASRQKAFTQELMEHYRLYPPLNMPVVAFRNSGQWTFGEMTSEWGLGQLGVHHGMALGDFDLDGDLDLVVNNLNGLAGLYRNDSVGGRVTVRLKGHKLNTDGIGAKVTLLHGAVPKQTFEIIAGGRYLSGSEPLAVFATGSSKSAMTIEIDWRSGKRSIINGVQSNRGYEIDEAGSAQVPGQNSKTEGAKSPERLASSNSISSQITNHGLPTSHLPQFSNLNSRPLFDDISESISHSHHETDFNDFERQPLLPFKLSQPGPGIAWFDMDGDGHDDLIIGCGSGGTLAIFRSDGRGGFSRVNPSQSSVPASDMSGLVGWIDGAGFRTLLSGVTGYEAPGKHAATQSRLEGQRVVTGDPIALEMSSSGALALGDINGDGQLALFIAGGVAPGRYPVGAPSKLYRQNGRQWQLDPRNNVLFDNLGIVNGAIWSDLTGDGLPELILACEWGPIRVFRNRGGLLFDATDELGLGSYKGWWKGVTTGDLDGNGKLDIIASNWGLNSPYQASVARPLTFMYGQLSQPGVTDVVETEYDPAQGAITPRRGFLALAASMQFLMERFPNHKAYSESTLSDVLGERIVLARRTEATTLASCAFLNRGSRFETIPLPFEAQLAPAFSVNVADFDGDGSEDVFLSQNFFPMQPEVPRLDAGRGLWLRGDGTGRLTPVSGSQSGIRIYGEQRGAALCDFNEDGRVDLAVSQTGAATKLYQNVGASPGLRVGLKGAPGNPSGVGAVIRMQFKERQGPAREIHAGSGYWSQDSFTQVMATQTKPEAVWIRWPGGRITVTPVPKETKEMTVDSQGMLVTDAGSKISK